MRTAGLQRRLRGRNDSLSLTPLTPRPLQSVSLLVASFTSLPAHRGSLLDEVMAGVLGAVGAKPPPREYLACEEGPVYVMLPSALLMQMVQVRWRRCAPGFAS